MQPCPAIPAMRGNSLGACVQDDVALANLYAECAQRVWQWIEWAELDPIK